MGQQRLKLAICIHERDGEVRVVAGIINLEEKKVEEIPISPLYNPGVSYKSCYHSRLASPCPIQPLDTNSNIRKATLFSPLARSAQQNGESGERKKKRRDGGNRPTFDIQGSPNDGANLPKRKRRINFFRP